MTERLYRLDASCDACSAAVPLKVYESELRSKLGLPPETPVQTVRCIECRVKHRRITVVTITARAYQRAWKAMGCAAGNGNGRHA